MINLREVDELMAGFLLHVKNVHSSCDPEMVICKFDEGDDSWGSFLGLRDSR